MPSMTFNFSSEVADRIAAALGKAHNLVDEQVPPQPRVATAAEVRAYGIARYKQLVTDIEGRDLTQAAVAAVVVPPMDLT